MFASPPPCFDAKEEKRVYQVANERAKCHRLRECYRLSYSRECSRNSRIIYYQSKETGSCFLICDDATYHVDFTIVDETEKYGFALYGLYIDDHQQYDE